MLKEIAFFSLVAICLIAAFQSNVKAADTKAETLISRTAYTDTFQNPDGSKTITIHSSIVNVQEDGKWKHVTEARSLKDKEGVNLVYLKRDLINDFDIVDFNYTSITFKIKTTDVKQNIVFKWGNSTGIYQIALPKSGTYTLKMPNIFAQNFTLGDASTTISLNLAGSDDAGDTYGRRYSTSDNTDYSTSEWLNSGWYTSGGDAFIIFNSFIKWNLSLQQRIGTGKTIDSAYLELYLAENSNAVNTYPNISVFGGYPGVNWEELARNMSWVAIKYRGTWNATEAKNWSGGSANALLTSNRSIGGGTVALWERWTITNWIAYQYSQNTINASLEVYDQKYNITHGAGYMAYKSKEFATVGLRPVLNITYSEGGPPGDTCTYTSGDWNILCSDNCRIANPVAVGGNHITITGAGTFLTIADITGWASVSLAGQDAANPCRVICDGGCFRK